MSIVLFVYFERLEIIHYTRFWHDFPPISPSHLLNDTIAVLIVLSGISALTAYFSARILSPRSDLEFVIKVHCPRSGSLENEGSSAGKDLEPALSSLRETLGRQQSADRTRYRTTQ